MPQTRSKKSGPTLGQEIIAGLADAVATARGGGLRAVGKKYTVRRVKRMEFDHPEMNPADVVSIRQSLSASQAVFGRMIGVSPGTIRAWEQGRKTPSPLARCFLAEVKRNRAYWQGQLRRAERKV